MRSIEGAGSAGVEPLKLWLMSGMVPIRIGSGGYEMKGWTTRVLDER